MSRLYAETYVIRCVLSVVFVLLAFGRLRCSSGDVFVVCWKLPLFLSTFLSVCLHFYTLLLQYLNTASVQHSPTLFHTPAVSQLFKKFCTSYGTRKFSIVFTKVLADILSQLNSVLYLDDHFTFSNLHVFQVVQFFDILISKRRVRATRLAHHILLILLRDRVVPWLRRLVSGRSPRRPGFSVRPMHSRFTADRVALVQVFVTQSCAVSVIPALCILATGSVVNDHTFEDGNPILSLRAASRDVM